MIHDLKPLNLWSYMKHVSENLKNAGRNNQLIAYFKACYQADNRALEIHNFMGPKIDNVLWLEEDELLNGPIQQYPVATAWGQNVFEHLLLHQKEQELILGAFFLIGKAKVGFNKAKIQKIVAPLLQIAVEIIYEDEVYFLRLKEEPFQLNPAVVRFLDAAHQSKSAEGQFSNRYDQLAEVFPDFQIDFDACMAMEKALLKQYPTWETDAFRDYPALLNEKTLQSHYRKIKESYQFQLYPGIAVGLVQKTTAAKGILTDLNQLQQAKAYSKPLEAVFSGQQKDFTIPDSFPIFSAANLSWSQRQVLRAVNHHTLTQVVGPPGTGKSFTIAAIAIDAICRGKSVLICSKYDQAVDVVAKKVSDDLGLPQVIARSGTGRNYKKALKDKLQSLIFGMGARATTELAVQGLQNQLVHIETKIERLENILLAREENEIKDGSFLSNYSGGFFNTIKKFLVERKILKTESYWNIVKEWEQHISRRTIWTKKFAKAKFQFELYQSVYQHRATFLSLLDELKQKPKGQKSKFHMVADFELLFKALPVWLCNTREVNQILPLKENLFDLVIIDEASQCDIASALPILQRGKRAVIVGDPQQLRHLSFLSVKRQRALQNQLQLHDLQGDPILQYRDNSLLDIVNRKLTKPSQLHFLNEHYRSQPEIIHFSNTFFYQNALNIMTDAPANRGQQSVHLHICKGHRNASGFNEIEAIALLEKLNELVEAQENESTKSSIRILSAFRGQVDFLKKRISENYEVGLIQAHQLLIGTPYHFQGEEKDIMLLSMAVDDDTHPSTFKYLNRDDVFNVSITRARREQHVFISSDLKRWNNDLLLVQYLDTIIAQKNLRPEPGNMEPMDYFAEEVSAFLRENQIDTIFHQYTVAGFPVDMIIQHGHHTYGIDLVGYPGLMEQAFPPERYQMLNRIGIPVFVLPYSQWRVERVLCEDQLLQFFKENVVVF